MPRNNAINAPVPIDIINGGTGAITANNAKFNLNTSSFVATVGTNILNTTGTGTAYDIVFDTIVNSIGSNYNNANGAYTVPANGFYCFTTAIYISNLDPSMTNAEFHITGGSEFIFFKGNPISAGVGGSDFAISGSCIDYLSAGDIIFSRIIVSGALSDTVTVNTDSRFGGYFLG